MGLLDRVKKLATKENIDKAKDLAGKNAGKISGGVDKVTDTIDSKTGGKHRDKLDRVDRAVEDNLEKLQDDPAGEKARPPASDPGTPGGI